MPDPNPLSVYYMASVLEERPTMAERLGPRIFSRWLPLKGYSAYRIFWEKIRDYSPMIGPYAMEDLPDTMDELDFESFQSDVMHWGARMTLSPKQIMFLRWAGQTPVANADTGYGVGPAADDYRAKDAAKIAKYTRMMNDGLDNTLEYLRVGSLLGQIWWPPRDSSGNEIAAADLPLSMGRQQLNHAVPFLAANADGGGFHQTASGLQGVTGSITATGFAWNDGTNSNMIRDMSVIGDLLNYRMNLNSDNLLLLCSQTLLAFQAQNTNILDWILGENRDRTFMTVSDQRNFIKTKFEWDVEFYDSRWEWIAQSQWDQTHPTIQQVRYMDTGTVLIIPRSEIMQLGVLASAPAPGPAFQWRDGKYMWMYTEPKPPFTREMGLGGFYWPLVREEELRFRLDAFS